MRVTHHGGRRRLTIAVLLLVTGTPSAARADWRLQSPLPTDRDLYGVAFADPMTGFLVGTNRHLLKTTDGGATWQEMTTLQVGSWWQLDFLNATAGFAGANGACSFTSDGGVTWILRSDYPDCPVMYSMDFRDALVGLVGGYVTALEYSLPEAGWVTLTLFDVQGRRIATLVDGPRAAGEHVAVLKGGPRAGEGTGATTVPAGVYFSRLEFTPSGSGGSRAPSVATTRLHCVR